MELSKKIYQLRKLAGMTQEQLAEKLNISRQTLSKWENGTSIPDVESVVRLSALFHTCTSMSSWTQVLMKRTVQVNDAHMQTSCMARIRSAQRVRRAVALGVLSILLWNNYYWRRKTV